MNHSMLHGGTRVCAFALLSASLLVAPVFGQRPKPPAKPTGPWMNTSLSPDERADLVIFAEGGHPPVGVTSIVGENGPELFVPKEAGTIIPAGKFGSSGGSFGAALAGLPRFSNVTNSGSMSIGSFNMQVHGPSNPKQFAEEVMKHIAYRAKSQGGPGFSPLSRAFQGASGGTNS